MVILVSYDACPCLKLTTEIVNISLLSITDSLAYVKIKHVKTYTSYNP